MNKNLIQLLSLIIIILFIAGCSKDDNPAEPAITNESEVLAQYLESNRDYIYKTPALISAEEVRQGQLNNDNQVILDLRTICEFTTKGHINGAVQLNPGEVLDYYEQYNLRSKDKVIITCLTGQSASYVTALLRLYGYNNVYGMFWGMTSWNPEFDYWSYSVGDSRASQFEKTPHEKKLPGDLPLLETGKSIPEEILKARLETLLINAFDDAQVSNETVYLNLEDFYIINYTNMETYSSGHVPNAVQYTPGQDMKLSTNLKTLPTDRIITVYCATGHTSAHIVAYLKLLGYKAKSILYGNNGMNHSTMTGKKFTPAEIHDYPFVR